ncbi:MAG: PEP-CTERM sorting domain-containing protein [Gemmataceae bacterium]|nr:PEP-CTERM sorting domain-containing protein [Gemmataceae bacterium]
MMQQVFRLALASAGLSVPASHRPRKERGMSGGIVPLAVVCLALAPGFARAEFMIDPDPGGVKMFIDVANKNVSAFQGFVGTNNPDANTPVIDVATAQNVNTGSGYANIKPAAGVQSPTLTSLTFTPQDPTLFGDFSFRGQLLAAGNVTVTVQDNRGGAPQTFTFSANKNADFTRFGIVAVAGSGETIKSVTISSAGFKEVKQIDFSFAEGVTPPPIPAPTVPEPSSALLLSLGLGACGVFYPRRARLKATVLGA